MILNEFAFLVQKKTGQPLSREEVALALSVAIKRFAIHFKTHFITEATVTIGTSGYASVPSNFNIPISLNGDSTEFKLTTVQEKKYLEYYDGTAIKPYFYVYNGNIYVNPEPDEDTAYTLMYYRTPTALTAGTDEIDFPDDAIGLLRDIVAHDLTGAFPQDYQFAVVSLGNHDAYHSAASGENRFRLWFEDENPT